MKKTFKLGLTVSLLALLLPIAAKADDVKVVEKFKFNAEARVRYEYFNNTDFSSAVDDDRDYFLTRFRPTLTFLPHEQVRLVFQPQFSAGWGEIFNTSTSSTNFASTGSTSSGLDDPTLGIHQAYMVYSPTDWFSLNLGRQELSYGDELLIGSVGWNNTGRAFDALKMRFTGEGYWVDAVYSLLSDQESASGRNACAAPCQFDDHHFGGLYASFDVADWLKALDAYAFYRYDDTTDPKAHNYVTFGTRLKGKSGNVDYRAEATGQFGKSTVADGVTENDQEDYQADLELGYTFADFKKFRVGVEGLVASENYIQLFPTSHKWLGYADLFGRRNVLSGILHLSMVPAEKWSAKLDAHTFFRLTDDRGLFRLNGTTEVGAGADTSKLAGEEIDLTVSYAPLPILSFDAGLSGFVPMGFLKENVGDDFTAFGFFQTAVKF